jgi:broad specificity phosphatase PhoE
MKRTRLLLIRHAQSEWNALQRWQGHADPPLDAVGRDQSERLAAYLLARGETPAALYTSPLRRALGTAEIVGAACGLVPVVARGLIEFHVGEFEGLTGREVAARYPELWARLQTGTEWVPIPGAEDRAAFCERAAAAVAAIVAGHSGATVAVVSHGGTLGAYLNGVLGLDPQRYTPFTFGNASLTILEHDPARPRLVLLNSQCHLEGQAAQSDSRGY